MNREQKRKFLKIAKEKGINPDAIKSYANHIILATPVNGVQDIVDGDKVCLNYDAIIKRENYNMMTQAYKDFVDDNSGVVFTARIEPGKRNLISLNEAPEWLFWCGDLYKVVEEDDKNNE